MALLDTFFTICCTLLLALIPVYSSKTEETRQCGKMHVCTTLMRYKDNTTVDEGNNCICREGPEMCSKSWEENDPRSLTWQHYERAHWSVQYKFCLPQFAEKKVCEPGELAAVVETDVKTWEPLLSLPRCVCEDGAQFKMMGWKRERGLWKYDYYCEKPECELLPENAREEEMKETDEYACAKIYVDVGRSSDKVDEMKFQCNCPDGYLCPAKFHEKEDMKEIVSDGKRKYVRKMCEPIVKRRKKDGSR